VSAQISNDVVLLEQRPLAHLPFDESVAAVEHAFEEAAPSVPPLVIGGHLGPEGPVGCFNGKIESPRVESDGRIVAEWDFARDIGCDAIRDVSANDHDGRLVNMPMRAVTGRRWTGDEIDWKRARGAVRRRSSTTTTSRTRTGVLPSSSSFRTTFQAASTQHGCAPSTMRSGSRSSSGRRARSSSPIALLMPTLSYLAYANEHAALTNPVAVTDFDLWDYMQPEDHLAMDVPLLGLYDKHRDGIGCCYSSRLRPVVNMRPHYHLPLVRSAHQFPADLHLVDWLDEKEVDVDVITDEDLHEEGAALLARYRVVLTGSHPEYWTTPMMDALRGYLSGGGRLMYLGGNGFYWVTSIDPARPHVIEVRRGRRHGTWRGSRARITTRRGEPEAWRDRGWPPSGSSASAWRRKVSTVRAVLEREGAKTDLRRHRDRSAQGDGRRGRTRSTLTTLGTPPAHCSRSRPFRLRLIACYENSKTETG
jgi:N,N-dimethylformamidase